MVTFSDKLVFDSVCKSGENWRCIKFKDPRSKYGFFEYQCFFGDHNCNFADGLKEGALFAVQRTEYQKKKSDGVFATVVLYKLFNPVKK